MYSCSLDDSRTGFPTASGTSDARAGEQKVFGNLRLKSRKIGRVICLTWTGADYPRTAIFPAWYACCGGGINDTAVCSSTARLYERRTTLPDEEWTFSPSTTNSEFRTVRLVIVGVDMFLSTLIHFRREQ
ncbi:unnamed protein product [Ectocarpus sp. CCAP 1310/34]|nr:unnamed protein product [Ectocarpus sp. CCAP 1310/34]